MVTIILRLLIKKFKFLRKFVEKERLAQRVVTVGRTDIGSVKEVGFPQNVFGPGNSNSDDTACFRSLARVAFTMDGNVAFIPGLTYRTVLNPHPVPVNFPKL